MTRAIRALEVALEGPENFRTVRRAIESGPHLSEEDTQKLDEWIDEFRVAIQILKNANCDPPS